MRILKKVLYVISVFIILLTLASGVRYMSIKFGIAVSLPVLIAWLVFIKVNKVDVFEYLLPPKENDI